MSNIHAGNPVVTLRVRREDSFQFMVHGREAWALHELIEAGERGCTPINNPAPRWSHYTWLLRKRGLVVETIHEPHGGAYSGTHARYVLRTPLQIIETIRQNEKRRSRDGTFQPLALAACGGAQ